MTEIPDSVIVRRRPDDPGLLDYPVSPEAEMPPVRSRDVDDPVFAELGNDMLGEVGKLF